MVLKNKPTRSIIYKLECQGKATTGDTWSTQLPTSRTKAGKLFYYIAQPRKVNLQKCLIKRLIVFGHARVSQCPLSRHTMTNLNISMYELH